MSGAATAAGANTGTSTATDSRALTPFASRRLQDGPRTPPGTRPASRIRQTPPTSAGLGRAATARGCRAGGQPRLSRPRLDQPEADASWPGAGRHDGARLDLTIFHRRSGRRRTGSRLADRASGRSARDRLASSGCRVGRCAEVPRAARGLGRHQRLARAGLGRARRRRAVAGLDADHDAGAASRPRPVRSGQRGAGEATPAAGDGVAGRRIRTRAVVLVDGQGSWRPDRGRPPTGAKPGRERHGHPHHSAVRSTGRSAVAAAVERDARRSEPTGGPRPPPATRLSPPDLALLPRSG